MCWAHVIKSVITDDFNESHESIYTKRILYWTNKYCFLSLYNYQNVRIDSCSCPMFSKWPALKWFWPRCSESIVWHASRQHLNCSPSWSLIKTKVEANVFQFFTDIGSLNIALGGQLLIAVHECNEGHTPFILLYGVHLQCFPCIGLGNGNEVPYRKRKFI